MMYLMFLHVFAYIPEPDMLSSNLYELMMNENRALFVDQMDGYLDFCSSKTRHVTFQNGCQITSLMEEGMEIVNVLM